MKMDENVKAELQALMADLEEIISAAESCVGDILMLKSLVCGVFLVLSI